MYSYTILVRCRSFGGGIIVETRGFEGFEEEIWRAGIKSIGRNVKRYMVGRLM